MIGRKKIRIGWLVSFAAVVSLMLIISCAALQQKGYHGIFMKGSIIETSDTGVYLCIGKKDGASVGQELDVYRITTTSGAKGIPAFKRELTGKIKIAEIMDEHFAKAAVISGTAEKHSIVELETR
ncbi:MAG: hypothetical protein WCH07_04330 [Deltaproteobacteria bacterium]